MKVFLLAIAVIAATAGLTACDTPGQTKVTKKVGIPENKALCTDSAKPYVVFVRKATKPGESAPGETIECVTEAAFAKYEVGSTYP